MNLREDDHELSMRLSPRTRAERDGAPSRETRSLIVHRLRDAPKAVRRLSMSRDLATADDEDYSVYCEPCGEWFQGSRWGEDGPDWAEGDDFLCPTCGRLYVAETVIYSMVDGGETDAQ